MGDHMHRAATYYDYVDHTKTSESGEDAFGPYGGSSLPPVIVDGQPRPAFGGAPPGGGVGGVGGTHMDNGHVVGKLAGAGTVGTIGGLGSVAVSAGAPLAALGGGVVGLAGLGVYGNHYAQQHGWYGRNRPPLTPENTNAEGSLGAPPVNWPCVDSDAATDAAKPRWIQTIPYMEADKGSPADQQRQAAERDAALHNERVEECRYEAGEPTNATFLEGIGNSAHDGWHGGHELADKIYYRDNWANKALGATLGTIGGGLGAAGKTLLNSGAAVAGGIARGWHAITD